MTSPGGSSGLTPGSYGVTGTDGSVPAKATHTQANVTSALQSGFTSNQFAGLGGGLINFVLSFIESAISGVLGGFDNVIDAIFGIAEEILTEIFRLLAELLSNVPIVGGALSDIVNQIADGLNATLDTANTAHSTATTAQATATTAQTGVATVTTTVNAPKPGAASVSANIYEDVSFHRAQLVPVQVASATVSSASTGSALISPHTHSVTAAPGTTGGTALSHTHSIPAVTVNSTTTNPIMTPTLGTLYLMQINASKDRPYSSAGFITSGSATMTHCYVGIYTIDSSGNATKVYDFGDIKGSLLSGDTDQRFTTTTDILSQAGNQLYVGLLQTGGTAQPLGAIPRWVVTPPSGVFPVAPTGYVTGQTSLPSTITVGSIGNDLPYWVWASLGQPSSVYDASARYSYSDSYQRSDGSGYGSNWHLTGNDQGVASGQAAIRGGSDGARGALYINALNTDDQSATIILGAALTSQSSSIFLRSPSDFSGFAECWIDSGGVHIGNSTAVGSSTSRATSSANLPSTGDSLAFQAVGNVYTATWRDQTLNWTDSGALITTGSARRYVGFGLERSFFVNSVPIESWAAQDI